MTFGIEPPKFDDRDRRGSTKGYSGVKQGKADYLGWAAKQPKPVDDHPFITTSIPFRAPVDASLPASASYGSVCSDIDSAILHLSAMLKRSNQTKERIGAAKRILGLLILKEKRLEKGGKEPDSTRLRQLSADVQYIKQVDYIG